MLYSAWASPEPQLHRQLVYKSWLGASGQDYHLTLKIGIFKEQKLHSNRAYGPGKFEFFQEGSEKDQERVFFTVSYFKEV